jgi:hypothetical protein
LGIQIFGLDSSSSVYRSHRQNLGRYRVCHEAALSKDPDVQGHWVARFTQGPKGHVCFVEVLDTALPDEMSNCLRDKALLHREGDGEAGQLELVLTFLFPWSAPRRTDGRL